MKNSRRNRGTEQESEEEKENCELFVEKGSE